MWKIIIKFVGQVLQQKERAKFFLSIFCYTATSQEVGAFRPLRVKSLSYTKKETQAKPSISLIPFQFQDIQFLHAITRYVATVKIMYSEFSCSK